MIAVPYYLLSIGIIILLIGFFMAALKNPRDEEPMIDPKMSDEEIAEKLQGGRGYLVPNLVIFLGGLLIVISLGWRILRALRVFF